MGLLQTGSEPARATPKHSDGVGPGQRGWPGVGQGQNLSLGKNPNLGKNPILENNPNLERDDRSSETPEILGQGSGPIHQVGNEDRVCRGPFAPLNRAVVIGNQPSRRSRIVSKSGDQMEMEMACTLAKSNRVHPITTRELAHQLAGLLNCRTPGSGLIGGEVGRSTDMAQGIEKQPTQQG